MKFFETRFNRLFQFLRKLISSIKFYILYIRGEIRWNFFLLKKYYKAKWHYWFYLDYPSFRLGFTLQRQILYLIWVLIKMLFHLTLIPILSLII